MSNRLLVLSRDPSILTRASKLLGGEGYEVVGAESLFRARDLFRATSAPAAIILDVPASDSGFVLCRTARSIYPATPLLVLTLSADPAAHGWYRSAGAASVLIKPVAAGDLITAVRSLAPLPGSGSEASRAAALGRRLVMTVEDDPDVARLLRAVLESGGYAVVWAGDLLTARTVLNGPRPPDLVITELLLWSGGSGLELCREIHATRPSTLLLVLTSWAYASAERDAVEAGADEFMLKPFDVDRLVRTVRRLLGESPDAGRAGREGA